MCLPIADQPAIGETVTVDTQLGLLEGEVTDMSLVADAVTGPRVELPIAAHHAHVLVEQIDEPWLYRRAADS
ncbi:MAG: hypothetical protein V5A34_05685 [Halapricum sp.]